MNRRSPAPLIWILSLLFSCVVLTSDHATADGPSAAGEKRPNILFIFSDDHAQHAIGAYDGLYASVNPTPNIDALARGGMLFKNSFCTNSICGPSRAVILTGLHSHLNGFMKNGNNFDGDQQTFPKLLRSAGYTTAMIGKWHLNSDPQGFDFWNVLPGQGEYYNPIFLNQESKRVRVDGYCTDIVTDKAINWLEENAKGDKPFMLMCQHKAPHRCWMPALRHLDLYKDMEMPVPDTLFDTWDDNAPGAKFQQMEIDRHMHVNFDLHIPHGEEMTDEMIRKVDTDLSAWQNFKKFTPEQRKTWNDAWEERNREFLEANLEGEDLIRWKHQRYIKNYLRCVKGVDESVGKLTQWLKDNGLDENTIVIYSSDQGFYLGDHGWYDKRWMYDESMSMPLIVSWPGVTEPGSINSSLVQNLDYAETFLDAAGAAIPENMQGESLVPLLKGETPQDWRQSVFYHYHAFPAVHMVPKHAGVRTATHKLIQFYEFGEWEFYDLASDPDEKVNQYDNPEYAGKIEELKAELERLKEGYQDGTDFSERPDQWKAKMRNR